MSLTLEQERAARRLGQDVCVVAGPGSGKTRVLIERFRWLVDSQGVPPHRILAITFTEKATTEIKQRLVKEFEGNTELRRQIERAYVSTIHGFCARLLEENAIAAGIDPDFTVLDEPRSQAVLREVAEEELDALFSEKPAELRAVLDALYVSTSSGGRQPDVAQSLTLVYEALRVAGAKAGELETSGPGPADGGVENCAAAVERILNEKLPSLTENQVRTHGALEAWGRRFLEAREAPPGLDHFELLSEYNVNVGYLKKGSIARELAKEIKHQWIAGVRTQWIGRYYQPLRALLVEALVRIDRSYRARKRDIAALDFSDLEEHAIDLLRSQAPVRARVQSAFDYILMDELQDTNRLQWLLLDLVRRPDRFFGVGDVNQSIYGFRHADPEIFQEYRSALTDRKVTVDELLENHRSRREILEAATSILGGVTGIEARGLVPKKDFPPKAQPSVEVAVGCGETAEQSAEIEARSLAERIRELEGALQVGESGRERPVRFSDMAVLVRSLNSLGPIQRALAEFQIPFLVAGGRTFFESREVRDLTRFLAVIANPRDEISLATVLRSPLVGIGDETLLRLKRAGEISDVLCELAARRQRSGKSGHLPLFGESRDGLDVSSLDAQDLERLRGFWALVADIRSTRDSIPPERMVTRALDEFGYESGLNASARANVEKLLAMLREMHRREPRAPAELLEELDYLRFSESEPEAPPDDSSNAVRLMSIHMSKGLEFPIVFVPALQRGVCNKLPPICYSPGAGLGVRWRDPVTGEGAGDVIYCRASEELRLRSEAEENRLFYVAMTRAQEHLVLSYAKSGSSRSHWHDLVRRGLSLEEPGEDSQKEDDNHTRVRWVSRPPENVFAAPAGAGERDEEIVDAPAAGDQSDSTTTVTRICAFVACPRKYYLAHHLGWQDGGEGPPAPAEETSVPGEDEAALPGAAELGIQTHKLLAGMAVEEASPLALRLANAFQDSPLGRRVAGASRVEREFDFLFELEDLVLRGQIDLWFEDGGWLVLADYKTDRMDPDREPARLAPYALQLRLYAMALRKLTGKLPDEALLHFLRSGRTVAVELDEPKLAAARETVRHFREAQSRLEFPLREAEQCLRCQFYRGLCPAGR